MRSYSFSTYISPFTWRYGSDKMREIFSEENKYRLWRKIWVEMARAQSKAGIVSKRELKDLEKNQNNINIERIFEIEKEKKHDVVAAILEFAEVAKIGGGKIHLGATSMDIVDNADTLRWKEALNLLEDKLKNLLQLFSKKIKEYAYTPCIGYTHLQPAEPTTVGYRLSFYCQDLFLDYKLLQFVKSELKGKGIKGAVGTGASFTALSEKPIMKELGIEPFLITSQVYTRKLDYWITVFLASLSSSLSKFAADLRLLQSANTSEWSEPFSKNQVGSSAMPFKKNPINCEKICSLARFVSNLPNIALENASLSYLERTLDDSANKRVFLPEAFLATDEIVDTAGKIIEGMVISLSRVKYNLAKFSPFAATESILLKVVQKGANRQEMHEVLRKISQKAWEEIMFGKDNPMVDLLKKDPVLAKYISREEIEKLTDVSNHIGNAPQRALKLVKEIEKRIY